MKDCSTVSKASDLQSVADRLGHVFADAGLLERALTHASHAGDGSVDRDYERLEFVGDRVLGLAVADLLYHAWPGEAEGPLAKRLTALVQQAALVQVGETLDLAPYIRVSLSERKTGVKEAMLADAVEALIGAVYLDAGYSAAAAVVGRLWQPLLDQHPLPPEEAKTRLQEWAQGRGLPLPAYQVIAQDGPSHAPQFTVRATVQGLEPAAATAPSKRAAEKAAAALLLAHIDSTEIAP